MSSFGKINWYDILKGFLIAAGTVVLTGIASILQAGEFPEWSKLSGLLMTGLAAGVTYLVKNIFTNSDNVLAKKENK